jgi:hypothetical protein
MIISIVLAIIYILLILTTQRFLGKKTLGILGIKRRVYHWQYLKHLFEFYSLIEKEKDLTLKRKYLVIFWSQFALIPIYFIGIIIIIRLAA